LSSLAEAYDEIGRYAEARAVGERSLALEKAALGPWHPAIADVLINLGNIADDEGDLARATDYYTRALDVRERAASGGADTSSGIADVLNNLGIIAFEQEHYDDALAYHHRALAIRETIDAGSPRVAMSLTNVADIARKRGNCDDALAGYRRALAIAEKRLGGMHPYVGDALYGIGECRLAQRWLDDAQTALERALAIRRAGARPVEIADIEFALARTRWARGDHAKALELARSARAAYATVPGNKQAAAVDTWLAHK
jgi:tetratricopeptide (TPR) repeat protein